MEEAKDTTIHTYPSGNKIVMATLDHAIEMSTDLRPYDKLECHANGFDPLYALSSGIQMGNFTYTVIDSHGYAVAMFGTGRNPMDHKPYVWLLGTNRLPSVAYEFLRESRTIVEWLVEPYGECYNYVYAYYDEAVKWLKFCGAEFLNITEIRGLPFIEFKLKALP